MTWPVSTPHLRTLCSMRRPSGLSGSLLNQQTLRPSLARAQAVLDSLPPTRSSRLSADSIRPRAGGLSRIMVSPNVTTSHVIRAPESPPAPVPDGEEYRLSRTRDEESPAYR